MEALVSLSVFSICVFIYQSTQIQVLKESRKRVEQTQMLRVAYEEVRHYRYYPIEKITTTIDRNGKFSIDYSGAPTSKLTISSENGQKQVIARVP
ncbi:MAG TPA: hypothetical protein H9829_02885 [Candidatus Tetragenococcus pullicola]|nr:hypothetical protein [Candidatus Tetragenococcus pullicola]